MFWQPEGASGTQMLVVQQPWARQRLPVGQPELAVQATPSEQATLAKQKALPPASVPQLQERKPVQSQVW